MTRRQRPPFDRKRNYVTALNGTRMEFYDTATRPYIRTIVIESRRASLTVNNPYRSKKPPGLWPPTARTLTHDLRINGTGTYRYTNQAGLRLYTIGVAEGLNDVINSTANYMLPAGLDERLRTEAIFDAMSKVKDQQWNAGVMLAEANGVVTMIEDFGNLIIRTRSALRTRRYKQAYREYRQATRSDSYPLWRRKYENELRKTKRGRAELKRKADIPRTWLYYHFGIAPTVNDISTAINQIGMGSVDSPFDMGGYVTGYAKETMKKQAFNGNSTFGRAGMMYFDTLRSVRVSIRVAPKPTFLNRLSKFGVTNPPEALWNRAPFSWVVDYFTTFGDWVSLLDVGLGWQFADKWTESFRTVRQCKMVYQRSGSYIPIGMKPATWNYKTINRVVRGDLYGPMGSVLPTLKRRGPSVQKISNLLSVIAGLFASSGHKPPGL